LVVEPVAALKRALGACRVLGARWSGDLGGRDQRILRWLVSEAIVGLTVAVTRLAGESYRAPEAVFAKHLNERLAEGLASCSSASLLAGRCLLGKDFQRLDERISLSVHVSNDTAALRRAWLFSAEGGLPFPAKHRVSTSVPASATRGAGPTFFSGWSLSCPQRSPGRCCRSPARRRSRRVPTKTRSSGRR
jgi:hypothetical protein